MICDIFVRHFNKLREAYKALYLEIKAHLGEKDNKRIKCYAKSKKLDEMLFASYESESDSSESEDETDSSSESSLTSSSSEEVSQAEDASTAASISNNQNRRPMKRIQLEKSSSIQLSEDTMTERRIKEIEENESSLMVTTLQVELKHMVLKKGASKGICLTPYSVTQMIEEQRNNLITAIHMLQEQFIDMVKMNPIISKTILEKNYFKRMKKQVSHKFHCLSSDSLFDPVSATKLVNEDVLASQQRQKFYFKSTQENSRGLPYQKNYYEFFNYPIIFEETYIPEISDTGSESNSDSIEESKINHTGDHVIFLVHGYKGKVGDMANIKSTIIKKFQSARVYV